MTFMPLQKSLVVLVFGLLFLFPHYSAALDNNRVVPKAQPNIAYILLRKIMEDRWQLWSADDEVRDRRPDISDLVCPKVNEESLSKLIGLPDVVYNEFPSGSGASNRPSKEWLLTGKTRAFLSKENIFIIIFTDDGSCIASYGITI